MNIYMINHEPWGWGVNPAGCITQFVIGKDDLIGDTITHRDELLEGRFMYWAWKNIHDDYIGLQFRRRFLYLRPMFEGNDGYKELNYNTDLTNGIIFRTPGADFIKYCNILSDQPVTAFDWIGEFDVLTSKPEIYGYPLGSQYCACHRAEDWSIFMEVMRAEGFNDQELSVGYLHPSNIWIMKWELFDEYMDLYWRVFAKLTQLITPPDHPYQNRVFGFLLERFFTIWLGRKHEQVPDLKVKLLPILMGDMP